MAKEKSAVLVAGGSRGVGRGVVLGLLEAGYRVFATGRGIETARLPDQVRRLKCDHTDDEQTAKVFRFLKSECDGLDILVNSVWGGYERMVEGGKFTWPLPFWEQPDHRWSAMMDAGVRAAFRCCSLGVPLMLPRPGALIVNISFWAARKHLGNVIYGVAKAATDKMTADMAVELRDYGISVVSLYPGLVRTEAVLEAAEAGWLNLSNSESPEFIGRVVAGLHRDPNRMDYSGKVLVAAELAEKYGIEDIDGRRPAPLTLDTV